VLPTSGRTTTTFVFSVQYVSANNPATSVVALVGTRTVPLSLFSGTALNGTYRGSSLLPAGSWLVTFLATAPKNDPTFTGPTVVVLAVTPAPTPTRRPTPVPTAAPPTASPTPAASVPPGSPSSSPYGATVSVQPSGTPPITGSPASGTITPTPIPGGGGGSNGSLENDLGTVLTGGLAAILLLAAVGFTAIWRDRRREQAAATTAAVPRGAVAPPPPPRRRASTWERDYAAQDEPIGTVDLDDSADEGSGESEDRS